MTGKNRCNTSKQLVKLLWFLVTLFLLFFFYFSLGLFVLPWTPDCWWHYLREYSSYKVVWWISALILIAHTKKCLLFQINTFTKFLLFRMKYIIDEAFCLIVQIYNHFIVSCLYEVIYLFLNCLCYFFLSIKLLFLNVFWNL